MLSNIRRELHRTIYRVLRGSGAALLHRRSAAVVFCYHNVVADEIAGIVGNPWLHAGVSEFYEQLEWIARAFTVVPIDELVTRLRKGTRVGGLAALTFDDGYTGCVRHAIPMLRNMSMPFALFPVVEASDERRPFWWDVAGKITTQQRDRYLTALRGDHDNVLAETPHPQTVPDDLLPASWTMLKSILRDDCTIGAHGVTHRNLSALALNEVTWELNHARERIGEEVGQTPEFLAYPYGRVNSTVLAQMETAGFKAGFGLEFGLVSPEASTRELARINVPAGLPSATFACWASGVQLRG